MEAVKVWGFSMCSAVVIGSIVTMIVPSIEKQKIMKLVISAFVLAGVISPLLNVIDEVDFSPQVFGQDADAYNQIEIDDNTLEELENSVSQSLFPLIQAELEGMNISNEFGVSVELARESEGIAINCVNITIADLHIIETEKISSAISENLGFDVNINNALNGEKSQNE